MNELVTAAAGIGSVMPVLVAVVVRSNWPNWVKGLIALATSLLLGVIAAAAANDLTALGWMKAALVVFGASQVAYHTWWKTSGIAGAIERATQPETAGRHAEANLIANPARSRAMRAKAPLVPASKQVDPPSES